jgi:hypothetical protein
VRSFGWRSARESANRAECAVTELAVEVRPVGSASEAVLEALSQPADGAGERISREHCGSQRNSALPGLPSSGWRPNCRHFAVAQRACKDSLGMLESKLGGLDKARRCLGMCPSQHLPKASKMANRENAFADRSISLTRDWIWAVKHSIVSARSERIVFLDLHSAIRPAPNHESFMLSDGDMDVCSD